MANTNNNERLMRLKKKLNKKKPDFKRYESWRYNRVKGGWRAARGIDSKTRQKRKSGIKSPNVGYRTPKAVRGLHPSGYKEVVVSNIKEVEGLSPEEYAVTIASNVGARKRMQLVEELQSKEFKILNSGIPYYEKLRMQELDLLDEELEEEED